MRLLILLGACVSLAADWPRFRGPNGLGVAESMPSKWTATENRLWTVTLPGIGNSSPIIAKGKLFIQCAAKDGSSRSLVCLDAATGKELWKKSRDGKTVKVHQKSSLASSTPACDGERVYTCFWDGKDIALVAYDLTGKELWTEKLGPFVSQHGAGLSPMVHAGKVFVNFDSDEVAEIRAFDAVTGKKAWEHKRKVFRACYSTPMIRATSAGDELLVLSTAGLTAYEPATGKPIWEAPFTWKGQALRSIAAPTMIGELIVCCHGDGGGARYTCAVRPGREPKIVWENQSSKLAPYVPNPLAVGKHLFWVTDLGVVECVNPVNGKVVWREAAFNANVSASPVLLGATILFIDEKGKALAVKADATGYEQVSVSEVGGPVFATPAAADGKLYIRSADKLLCIGAK